MFRKRQNMNRRCINSKCEFFECEREIENKDRQFDKIGFCDGCSQGTGYRRGRRRIERNISGIPASTYFKPNGIPISDLEVIQLNLDEFEALRLKNIENLDQNTSAEKMKISQSTFARILDSAYKKVSIALIHGYAIEIQS